MQRDISLIDPAGWGEQRNTNDVFDLAGYIDRLSGYFSNFNQYGDG
jgi:hypothetical protein